MRWKVKGKNQQNHDSKAVTYTDKKARLRIGARKGIFLALLLVLVVGGMVYYQRRHNVPNKQPETHELTPEEIQQQIEEQGRKGPTVDPNTIPHTR